jgi:hypothetical protein
VRRPQRTPKTHYLHLRIIAVVAQSTKPMTVADVSSALEVPADIVAQCIGLHLYLERKRVSQLTIPPPADYWIPKAGDVISRDLLEPKRVGRVLAVDAAIRGALGTGGQMLH